MFCGIIEVPEDNAKPDGKKISLKFSIFKSWSQYPEAQHLTDFTGSNKDNNTIAACLKEVEVAGLDCIRAGLHRRRTAAAHARHQTRAHRAAVLAASVHNHLKPAFRIVVMRAALGRIFVLVPDKVSVVPSRRRVSWHLLNG